MKYRVQRAEEGLGVGISEPVLLPHFSESKLHLKQDLEKGPACS